MLKIGAGRFVALERRGLDMRVLVHDNGVYGFTKGQPSPTPPVGLKTKSTPKQNVQYQVTLLVLALASSYTFVTSGGFSLERLIKTLSSFTRDLVGYLYMVIKSL